MHETETRALRRAAVALVIISVVRWGWGERRPGPPSDESTVLPELLAASSEAVDEEARRNAPLGAGERVDVNQADEVELDRLPGIGAATARTIVAARESGMVFRRPQDLLGVSGIGPATLDRLRAFLAPFGASAQARVRTGAGATPITDMRGPVDLNGADLEGLITLPGIGPAIAERILVARREQPFTSLDDVVRVRGIGPATLERLRPYASVGRRGPR
jgi:competence protein ComEA